LLIRINFKKILIFAMRYSFTTAPTTVATAAAIFQNPKAAAGCSGWSIFIFLLLALATVSWFFSIMVFSYPEKPFHYKLLTKLEKLEPIKKFPLNSVPHGEFVTAGKLLEQYLFFTPDKFRVTNDVLKREYIRNFKERSPPRHDRLVCGGRRSAAERSGCVHQRLGHRRPLAGDRRCGHRTGAARP